MLLVYCTILCSAQTINIFETNSITVILMSVTIKTGDLFMILIRTRPNAY